MSIEDQIREYIESQPAAKQADMDQLHAMLLRLMPGCRLWYLDGRNEQGRVVSNPNIGYGSRTLVTADGTTREFFRIGLSANTGGLSLYVMGLKDKTYLPGNFGQTLGKATVTGYCIKFKRLEDLHLDVLEAAVLGGLEQAGA
jgi:hypothetical protein